MDSDEEDFSYEEEDDEGDDSCDFGVDADEGFDSTYDMPNTASGADDIFTYEVLTPDTIVSYMNTIIDEVDAVFQVRISKLKCGGRNYKNASMICSIILLGICAVYLGFSKLDN